MRPSAWLALPLFAISTYTLVITPAVPNPHDVSALAGSIDQKNTTHISNSTRSLLELEYESLDILKQQLFQLHHEVINKERDILHLINRDFESCSGVKCYLQTALRKAPDFFQLFKTHFRHHPSNSTESYGCLWSTNSSRSVNPVSPAPSDGPFNFNGGDPSSPFDFNVDEDNHFDFNAGSPPDGSFDFNGGNDDGPFDFNRGDESNAPSNFEAGDDMPPPDADNSPFNFNSEPPNNLVDSDDKEDHPFDLNHDEEPHESYNPYKPNNAPPSSNSHNQRPPFRMPHPAPRPRHFRLILATAGLVVSLLILIILVKALYIYCANPRVRAERAARIEECRTKREYRRAACQHRLRQCLSRFCRRDSRENDSTDYEEKRSMLRGGSAAERVNNHRQTHIPVTSVHDHIIGANITSLRQAHDLVISRLLTAEEGRSLPFPLPSGTSPPSVHSIHTTRSTTTSLPSYTSQPPPPPRYSSELSREIHTVVDGFRFTPTPSAVTPSSSASTFMFDDDDDEYVTESSVVDCRSRMSMETGSVTVEKGYTRRGSLEVAGDRWRGRFD